jgi:hypothetical protein
MKMKHGFCSSEIYKYICNSYYYNSIHHNNIEISTVSIRRVNLIEVRSWLVAIAITTVSSLRSKPGLCNIDQCAAYLKGRRERVSCDAR